MYPIGNNGYHLISSNGHPITNGTHWMTVLRIHGYKILLGLGTIFILMQFVVNFTSFHHHFKKLTDFKQDAINNSFLDIAKKWESQDLEVKRIMLSKDYLTKNDELVMNINNRAKNESSQELCPLVPPKLGELFARKFVETNVHSQLAA